MSREILGRSALRRASSSRTLAAPFGVMGTRSAMPALAQILVLQMSARGPGHRPRSNRLPPESRGAHLPVGSRACRASTAIPHDAGLAKGCAPRRLRLPPRHEAERLDRTLLLRARERRLQARTQGGED